MSFLAGLAMQVLSGAAATQLGKPPSHLPISSMSLQIICADISTNKKSEHSQILEETLVGMLDDGVISHIEAQMLGYSVSLENNEDPDVAEINHPKIVLDHFPQKQYVTIKESL